MSHKQKAWERAMGMGGYAGSPLHREDKQLMLQKLAELIAPDEWTGYNANNGVVTNQDGWGIKDSLHAAKRIMDEVMTSDVLFVCLHKQTGGK